MGQGLQLAGFLPGPCVEWSTPVGHLLQLDKSKVLCCDVATPHLGCVLLRHLLGVRPVVIAGASCQPWSALGDGKQHADDRAASLHAVLKLIVHLQAPFAILENVVQCWDDPATQGLLHEVCQVNGWVWTNLTQNLQDDWTIHRTRGWVTLGPPALVQGLRMLPPADFNVLPKHVLPQVPTWPPDQRDSLCLTETEKKLYSDHICSTRLPTSPQEEAPNTSPQPGQCCYCLRMWVQAARPLPLPSPSSRPHRPPCRRRRWHSLHSPS